MVEFASNRDDFDFIDAIAKRAWNLEWVRKAYRSRFDVHMDVSAVHANGNPLRLDGLLNADDFNFAHDIAGIARHLDRETGKLDGRFRPRFSMPATAAESA